MKSKQKVTKGSGRHSVMQGNFGKAPLKKKRSMHKAKENDTRSTEDKIVSLVEACTEVGFFEVQKEMLEKSTDGACINASYIGLEVLRRINVDASPSAWDVMIYNGKAEKLMKKRVPISDWPEDAWSIGVDRHRKNEHGVGYHVVIEVGGGILDLSSFQFNRPSRGIYVTPSVWFHPASLTIFNGKPYVHQHRDNPSGEDVTHYTLINRRPALPVSLRKARGFSSDGITGTVKNGDWIDAILQEVRT